MACTRNASNKPCVEDDSSVRSGTSSIALECHSRLILEELSAMVDDEDSEYESEDDESQGEEEKRREEQGQDVECEGGILNWELNYRNNYANSEISLDSILEDDTVSLVRRREARIVDREVRTGSQLFRSRSDAAFVRTGSLLGRVIRSASGRVLHPHSSARIGAAGNDNGNPPSIAGKNETFKHSAAEDAPNAKAREAGHALLVECAPRSRRGSTSSRRGSTCSDSVASTSSAELPNMFKESMDSTSFIKLLNNDGTSSPQNGQMEVSFPTLKTAASSSPPLYPSFEETSKLSSLESRFGESLVILEECSSLKE